MVKEIYENYSDIMTEQSNIGGIFDYSMSCMSTTEFGNMGINIPGVSPGDINYYHWNTYLTKLLSTHWPYQMMTNAFAGNQTINTNKYFLGSFAYTGDGGKIVIPKLFKLTYDNTKANSTNITPVDDNNQLGQLLYFSYNGTLRAYEIGGVMLVYIYYDYYNPNNNTYYDYETRKIIFVNWVFTNNTATTTTANIILFAIDIDKIKNSDNGNDEEFLEDVLIEFKLLYVWNAGTGGPGADSFISFCDDYDGSYYSHNIYIELSDDDISNSRNLGIDWWGLDLDYYSIYNLASPWYSGKRLTLRCNFRYLVVDTSQYDEMLQKGVT